MTKHCYGSCIYGWFYRHSSYLFWLRSTSSLVFFSLFLTLLQFQSSLMIPRLFLLLLECGFRVRLKLTTALDLCILFFIFVEE
jgi:hypothetical protein